MATTLNSEALTPQKRAALKKKITETPEVEALRAKLREIADAICVYDNLCPDVYTYLHHDKYGLGLGPVPRPNYFKVELTLVLDGVEQKIKAERNAYTEGAARLQYLAAIGVTNPFSADFEAPAAEGEDPPEVAAYKQMIVAAVKDGINDGRIKRSLVNRYFPHLGIPKIPGRRRFTFVLEVTPPEKFYVTYQGDGLTQEEALANAQPYIKSDLDRMARGVGRSYANIFQASDARFCAPAEGAELQLDPNTPPRDLE